MMTRTEELIGKVNQYIHQCNLDLGLDILRLKPQTSDEVQSVFEPIITKWTNKILQACKEAGLEFVVKDAELPEPKAPLNDLTDANYAEGFRDGLYRTREVGFHKTEEIEIEIAKNKDRVG